MSSLGFTAWYRLKLGQRPIWQQVILWFFYGFIWIPLWYLNARDKAVGASSQRDGALREVEDHWPELASAGRRFIGFTVDLSLIVLVGIAFGQFLYSAWDPYQRDRQTTEIMQAALASAFGWYYWLFEGIWGRTPGKFITGTRVTRPDGTSPGWRPLVRLLIRMVPLDFLSLRNGVMWHDTWTGTRVIRWPPRQNARPR